MGFHWDPRLDWSSAPPVASSWCSTWSPVFPGPCQGVSLCGWAWCSPRRPLWTYAPSTSCQQLAMHSYSVLAFGLIPCEWIHEFKDDKESSESESIQTFFFLRFGITSASVKNSFPLDWSSNFLVRCPPQSVAASAPRYTHISDVFTVAVMALVVKFYSFNDGLMLGTLLAMTFFTLRYSGTQAGVKTAGDARGLGSNGWPEDRDSVEEYAIL